MFMRGLASKGSKKSSKKDSKKSKKGKKVGCYVKGIERNVIDICRIRRTVKGAARRAARRIRKTRKARKREVARSLLLRRARRRRRSRSQSSAVRYLLESNSRQDNYDNSIAIL